MNARNQLVRYVVVGVASNASLYVLYLVLTALSMGPRLAMSLLYIVGVLQTFVLNKRWTFGYQGMHGTVLIRYCMAYGFGYVVNLSAMMILVERLGYPHQIVQGLMIFLVAAMLFLMQRYLVFWRVPGSEGTR